MVRITLEELERQFGQIAAVTTNLQPVLTLGGQMYLNEVKQGFTGGYAPDRTPWSPLRFPRPQGGNKPLLNYGLLRASYTAFTTRNSFGVGTNARQANLLHFGGMVVPVNKQWLTIPLTLEAVRAGRAPNMPGLFWLKPGPGRRWPHLAERTGKGIVRHWILVKRVVIPPRPQIGVTDIFLDRWKTILVNYLRTGSLT